MTDQEHFEFESFCIVMTNDQLYNIIEKEKEFADVDEYRRECLRIAQTIARLRGMDIA